MATKEGHQLYGLIAPYFNIVFPVYNGDINLIYGNVLRQVSDFKTSDTVSLFCMFRFFVGQAAIAC